LRVLLVDDDAAILAGLARLLERDGCRVTTAASGSDALARLDTGERYDLIVSDHVMPGISGLDLAQAVRTAHPGTPVVLLAGRAEALPPAVSVSGGLHAILQKPVRYDELAGLAAALRPEG
jgi:CheY-like chemotaxis protein